MVEDGKRAKEMMGDKLEEIWEKREWVGYYWAKSWV